jgi:hypothetical protein
VAKAVHDGAGREAAAREDGGEHLRQLQRVVRRADASELKLCSKPVRPLASSVAHEGMSTGALSAAPTCTMRISLSCAASRQRRGARQEGETRWAPRGSEDRLEDPEALRLRRLLERVRTQMRRQALICLIIVQRSTLVTVIGYLHL